MEETRRWMQARADHLRDDRPRQLQTALAVLALVLSLVGWVTQDVVLSMAPLALLAIVFAVDGARWLRRTRPHG